MSTDNFDNELSRLYQQRKNQTQVTDITLDLDKGIKLKRSPWHVVAIFLMGGAASFGIMAIVTHFSKPAVHGISEQYIQHTVRIVELGEVISQEQGLTIVNPELPPQPSSLSPKNSQNRHVSLDEIVLLKPQLPVQKALKNSLKVPKINAQLIDIRPIHRVMPEYPKSALHARKFGTVKLQYRISNEGKAVDITSLNKQVDRVLERSAKKALTQWRYPLESSSDQLREVEFEFNLPQ
ncbi:TonB family protein [Colwellia sp. 6M3]|jgi:TonB family protein|uniref:TonB family protein n=1 Tax=Colwellia sp. 6M3 TaxID=2759849 RepID=UPI0015F672D3|nr:TonB family protein [Colwellia sp. 6M3]MBA6415786.1 TonB family protein [Colwellia sp. 6M3]